MERVPVLEPQNMQMRFMLEVLEKIQM